MSERVAISKKLVAINFIGSAFTQVLSVTVLFWLQAHLLHQVSDEEYSILPVLNAIMMFTPLATVVLTGGIGRYITEAYAKGDDAQVTKICSTMFPILAVAGLVMLGAGWLFAWKIDLFLNLHDERVRDAQIMMAMLVFAAALRMPAAPFGVGFFVRQRFNLLNLINIGCVLFRIVLLFALIFGVSTRVLWVATATTAMELLVLAITTPISMRLVPALRFRRSMVDWSIAREITSFGGWQFLMVLGLSIRNAIDPIVLNAYSTAFEIACFNIASLPFQHLWQTINMAKRTINPSLIAMHAGQESERLRSAFLRGNRLALWLFMLPGLPLALLAFPFIQLWLKGEVALAPALIQINLLGFLVIVPTVVFATIVEAIGKPRDFCLLVLGTNLLNLALTLYFVGWLGYGATGSCLATAISSAVCYPLLVWPLSRRMLDVTSRDWFREVLLPGLLPSLCAAPIYLGAAYLLNSYTIVGFAGSLALGIAAYVVCLYAFAARPRDLDDFRRLIPFRRQ